MAATPESNPKSPPLVFISYSRKDEKWRARLHTFLKPAIDAGIIDLWDDRAIDAGEKWNQKIDEAINTAAVAVLLISAEYLASKWIHDQEVPHILNQGRERNLRLLPILLRPCPWQQVEWLRSIQIFPPDAKPLVGSRTQDKLFVEAAQRITRLATEQTSSAAPTGTIPDEPSPAKSPQQTDVVTVDALSSFVLSNEARDILRRAQVLATFGATDNPKVTSTCLLFGIAEGGRDQTETFRTPQFLWRELQRADAAAYEKVFRERFPNPTYYSTTEIINFDRADRVAVAISDNVLNLFRRAQEISIATLGMVADTHPKKDGKTVPREEERFAGHVSARHLLAALLVLEETRAMKRLSRILDVAQLRAQLLKFIERSLPDDDFNAWQEILGATVSANDEAETTTQTETDNDFRVPLAGFSADYWEGEDLLGITRDVNALASLVAARSIDPPLSIGLFGDWGSGKTHFMRQMRARVQKLSQQARDSRRPQSELGYHKKIVQIEFNAWHYIEGNLWASLVEHIFDNLRITDRQGDRTEVEDAREKIMEKLGVKAELQKKVEQRQLELKTKAEAARGRAEEAKNKRADTSQDLVNLRNPPAPDIINQLTTIEISPEQKALLEQLGIPESVQRLPAEIHRRYEDAQTFWGHLRVQWNVIRADSRWVYKLLGVLVAFGITLAVGFWLRNRLSPVYSYLASLVAFVGAAWAAMKPYAEKFRKSMDALREKYDGIEQERQKQIVTLESEVNSLTREMNAAENEAKAINKEVSTLETKLKSTDAAELLAGFIEDRAACEDYRRHLGMLALIRRDFEKLSNLLSEQRRDEGDREQEDETKRTFSRIILYIDDLDRCPPEQVVKVLQAIHLLLAFPLFVVIVGVDARWVTRSLQESYEWLGVDGDQDRHKDKNREPNQEKREMVEDRVVTPHDYLEKIFQIPFWLKPMGERDCENLLHGLTKESRASSSTQQNGAVNKESKKPEGSREEATEEKNQAEAAVRAGGEHSAETQIEGKRVAEPAPLSTTRVEPADQSDQSALNQADATSDSATKRSADPESEKPKETFAEQSKQVDEDSIDLAPKSLTLTDAEVQFMMKLTTLIGRSPRAVKRFLNCYRLIKVGLTPAELKVFMGGDSEQVRYAPVMLLLGIITGAPSVSLYIIEELEEYSRSKKTMNLNTLLLKLEENPEVKRQQDWLRVREILEDQIGFDEGSITLASLIKETPRVSRYSFRVARAAGQQRRIRVPQMTKADVERAPR
jgi:hypothetical protein